MTHWKRRDPLGSMEIETEFEFHLERLKEHLCMKGMSAEEAASEAHRRFGDPVHWRDKCLAVWMEPSMFDKVIQVTTLAAVLLLGVFVWSNHKETEALGEALQAVTLTQSLSRSDPLALSPEQESKSTRLQVNGLETSPEHLLELNRSGRWSESAQLAERMLASAAGDLMLTDRAQVMLSLAYSRLRNLDHAGSRRVLAEFQSLVSGMPQDHWLFSHAKQIETELSDSPNHREIPEVPGDDSWKSANPAEVGLDPAIIEEHRVLCEETGGDSCLLVYRGQIVSEWTSPKFSMPVYAMSSTKSVTSLLVGCLIDDGLLQGIDVPVGEFLPEWKEGDRGKVTLRHLLSHTSGLPKLTDRSVGFESDKNTFVRALAPSAEPGSTFAYSNEGVQLLSPILDIVAGETIQDYAQSRLFTPLGMRSSKLQLDAKGHAWTYADMNTSPRDMARIGMLMLQGGVFNGKRVVSERWIAESTRKAQEFRKDCGLLWWIHEDPLGFAALGYLHTDIHVFPNLDLVAVRTQSKQRDDGKYPDYRERALALFKRLVK